MTGITSGRDSHHIPSVLFGNGGSCNRASRGAKSFSVILAAPINRVPTGVQSTGFSRPVPVLVDTSFREALPG